MKRSLTVAIFLSELWVRSSLVEPFSFFQFAVATAVAVAVYVAAIVILSKSRTPIGLKWVFLSAVLVRLLFLSNHPILSGDLHRYIWDGNVLNAGLNPLAYAPSDPRLAGLIHGIPLPPDHQGVPSVYPPLALLIFSILAKICSHPIIFQLGASLMDGLSSVILGLTLRRRGQSMVWALLFAWHPVSILESGYGGHVDSFGIFFLCLALYFGTAANIRMSLSVAAMGLIKLWPASLFPLLFASSRRKISGPLLAAGTFVIPCAILWTHAGHLNGLQTYVTSWEFNGGIYSFIRSFASGKSAHALCALLFFVVLIGVMIRSLQKTEMTFETGAFFLIAAFLLLSPVVYPWYSLWLLPFLVLRRRWVWIYFTLVVVSSYAVVQRYLSDRVWEEPLWPKLITYLPLYGALAVQFCRGRFAVAHMRSEKTPSNPA